MTLPRQQNSLTISNSLPSIVIHFEKQSLATAAVEQVLQMNLLQFLKPSLIPEHCSCTHFFQFTQRIEFAPTSFQHIPHGNSADVILVLRASCLEHMTFVFPMFMLTLFAFNRSSPLISFSTHQMIQQR